MIPESVRRAAFNDRRRLTGPLDAARNELIAGWPTGQAIHTASKFAQIDPKAGIGGRTVAHWLAGASLRVVPDSERGGRYDTWIVEARLDPDVPLQAALGAEARPQFLAEISAEASRLEDIANVQLRTILQTAVAVLARRAGLVTMDKIGDPDIRAAVSTVPIGEVAEQVIRRIGVESFRAATATQIDAAVDRALADLTVSVRDTLEDYYRGLRQILESVLGMSLETDNSIEAAITAATETALNLFTEIVDARIRPEEVADVEDPNRTISSIIYAGVATRILAALSDQANASGSLISRVLRSAVPLVDTSGLPNPVATVVNALRSLPEALTLVTVWRHGYYGRGETDFAPHKRLDGLRAGSQAWDRAVVQPLVYTRKSDGATVQREPFRNGRWFPGDHVGCTCKLETTLAILL
jgi:hypothetical protein